mmetsp:Transcript_569/g.1102  ORF Transcript_569/g.1102 Transcript_569/m.1102 type:complete len:243 (-) Transcript_569:346-1074(-)
MMHAHAIHSTPPAFLSSLLAEPEEVLESLNKLRVEDRFVVTVNNFLELLRFSCTQFFEAISAAHLLEIVEPGVQRVVQSTKSWCPVAHLGVATSDVVSRNLVHRGDPCEVVADVVRWFHAKHIFELVDGIFVFSIVVVLKTFVKQLRTRALVLLGGNVVAHLHFASTSTIVSASPLLPEFSIRVVELKEAHVPASLFELEIEPSVPGSNGVHDLTEVFSLPNIISEGCADGHHLVSNLASWV